MKPTGGVDSNYTKDSFGDGSIKRRWKAPTIFDYSLTWRGRIIATEFRIMVTNGQELKR